MKYPPVVRGQSNFAPPASCPLPPDFRSGLRAGAAREVLGERIAEVADRPSRDPFVLARVEDRVRRAPGGPGESLGGRRIDCDVRAAGEPEDLAGEVVPGDFAAVREVIDAGRAGLEKRGQRLREIGRRGGAPDL